MPRLHTLLLIASSLFPITTAPAPIATAKDRTDSVTLRQIGQSSTRSGFLHVAFTVDVLSLATLVREERLALSDLRPPTTPMAAEFATDLLPPLRLAYDSLLDQVEAVLHFGMALHPATRFSRGAIGMILTTVFGLFSGAQSKKMKQKLDKQQARIQDLYLVADDHENRLGSASAAIQLLANSSLHLQDQVLHLSAGQAALDQAAAHTNDSLRLLANTTAQLYSSYEAIHSDLDATKAAMNAMDGRFANVINNICRNVHQLEDIVANTTRATQTSLDSVTAATIVLGDGMDDMAGNLASTLQFSRAVSAASLNLNTRRSQVQEVFDILAAANNHRLSPKAVAWQGLPRLFHDMATQAKSAGYTLSITERAHLFQLDTTTIMNPAGNLTILLHVPIARPASFLRLYQLLPLPFPYSPDIWILFDPRHDVIGIADDGSAFRTMPRSALDACRHFGDTFVCPEGNTALQDTPLHDTPFHPDGRCIRALFARRATDAETNCPRELTAPYNDVLQVSPASFVVYSTVDRSAVVTCPALEGEEPALLRLPIDAPRSSLSMRPGCTAVIDGIMTVATAPEFTDDDRSFSFSWPSDIKLLLGRLNISAYQHARDDLHRLAPSDVNAAEAWTAALTAPAPGTLPEAAALHRDLSYAREETAALRDQLRLLADASTSEQRELAVMKSQSSLSERVIHDRLDEMAKEKETEAAEEETTNWFWRMLTIAFYAGLFFAVLAVAYWLYSRIAAVRSVVSGAGRLASSVAGSVFNLAASAPTHQRALTPAPPVLASFRPLRQNRQPAATLPAGFLPAFARNGSPPPAFHELHAMLPRGAQAAAVQTSDPETVYPMLDRSLSDLREGSPEPHYAVVARSRTDLRPST
jgi:hypothetical protein